MTGKARRMRRVPKELLPYSEVQADGGRRPVEGRIGGHFVSALDRHIERAREVDERHIEPGRMQKEKMWLGEWLHEEAKARDANNSWSARENIADGSQTRRDRVALGEAVEKNLLHKYAALDYERALKLGDMIRFPARDVSIGNERQISEADVRRRADARGARAANDQNLRNAVERQKIRRQVSCAASARVRFRSESGEV